MTERVRAVAWAIAEAWWRKTHRRVAGSYPEANSPEEYADNFWQNFQAEAQAALRVVDAQPAAASTSARRPASDRFA